MRRELEFHSSNSQSMNFQMILIRLLNKKAGNKLKYRNSLEDLIEGNIFYEKG